MKDLRSTIFYFENVADALDDPERGASIQVTIEKLKGIRSSIEEEIKGSRCFHFQRSWLGDDNVVHSCGREHRGAAHSG